MDIIGVLTEQPDARGATLYWGTLKRRLKQVLTNCQQLPLTAQDGKKRRTDVADAENLLRLVQSVLSPKAEPVKLWLAQVGYERMHEMVDPEIALNRSRELWRAHGRSEKWIEQRMLGQETRNKLTDYWKSHDIREGKEYAILTNVIHKEWSGVNVKDHKKMRWLKDQNLRDHMTEAELIFTALAELSTRRIAESRDATGMAQNSSAAKEAEVSPARPGKSLRPGLERRL